MQTYLTSNNQLRIETDESIIENLKRKGWLEIPQPSYNQDTETCEWQNGEWVVQPIILPSYTAEEWLDKQSFQGSRPTACLYFKLQLDAQNKVSPKLNAVQNWMNNILAEGVINPDNKKSDWLKAPYTFQEANMEALQVLNS